MIAHIVRAHAYGGVEQLMNGYLKASGSEEKPKVIGIKKPFSKVLHKEVEQSTNFIGFTREILSLRIPSFLRFPLFNYRIKKYGINKLIFWNVYERAFTNKKLSAPYIYYDHGLSWFEKADSGFPKFLQGAERFITCSYASKKILQLRWGVKKQIDVITNPLYPIYQQPLLEKRKFPKDRPIYLGLAARYDSGKGHLVALQLLKELLDRKMDVYLHLIGKGGFKEVVDSQIKKMNLGHRVRQFDFTPNLSSFYKEIDFSLNLSFIESWGLSSLEAGAMGCIPCAAHIDGLAEFIEEGETGFLVEPTIDLKELLNIGCNWLGYLPEAAYYPARGDIDTPRLVDPVKMADKIESVLQNEELFERVSANCMKRFQENYSFDAYIEKLQAALTR